MLQLWVWESRVNLILNADRSNKGALFILVIESNTPAPRKHRIRHKRRGWRGQADQHYQCKSTSCHVQPQGPASHSNSLKKKKQFVQWEKK